MFIRSAAHLEKLRENHVMPWFASEGLTVELQVVASRNGIYRNCERYSCFGRALLKRLYNQVQEEWLNDPTNAQKWEQRRLAAHEQRVLITHWLAEAGARFRAAGPRACLAAWKRTGCGLTIDGSTDDAISITGVRGTNLTYSPRMQQKINCKG